MCIGTLSVLAQRWTEAHSCTHKSTQIGISYYFFHHLLLTEMSAPTIIKVLLGVIAVMLLSNLYTLWYMSRLIDDMVQTTKISLPSVYHASDMNTNISDYRIREWRHCLAIHPDSLRHEESAAEQEANRASLHIKELQSIIPSVSGENALIQKVDMLYTQYLQQSSAFFAFSRQGNKRKALQFMYGELRREYDELGNVLADLVHLTVTNAQERTTWYEQTIRTTRFVLLTVILGAAFVSVAIVVMLVRSLGNNKQT